MDPKQCKHGTTWRCLLYRAHARSMKKHGETLTDQAKQCLACHKNKKANMAKSNWQKKVLCQMCEQTKSCTKCHGLILCSACISVIQMVKKRPEVIRKIWEQYGPADIPFPERKDPARRSFWLPNAAAIAAESSRERGDAQPMENEAECHIELILPSAFSKLLGRMAAIHIAKKHDYASNEDCLGNFREAKRLGLTPLQGIMIRLTDEYTQACNLVRRNGARVVKDETLENMLLNLANYSCLAILANKEEQVEDKRLKAEAKETHNAKDMHQDQGPADTAGDLPELQKKVSICGEEEGEQVKEERL